MSKSAVFFFVNKKLIIFFVNPLFASSFLLVQLVCVYSIEGKLHSVKFLEGTVSPYQICRKGYQYIGLLKDKRVDNGLLVSPVELLMCLISSKAKHSKCLSILLFLDQGIVFILVAFLFPLSALCNSSRSYSRCH